MTIAKLARAEIRALKPYEAAIQVDNTIRLKKQGQGSLYYSYRLDYFRQGTTEAPAFSTWTATTMISHS